MRSSKKALAYTIYVETMGDDIEEHVQEETGYVKPRHYYFRNLVEAKKAMAGPMFEGKLSLDGMSKTFWDEFEGDSGARVSYIIRPIYNQRVVDGLDFYTDYHRLR